MLKMTEAAGEQIVALLDRAQAPEGVAIRFVVDGDAFALDLDEPHEGDTTFDHKGRTVLVLENRVAEMLQNSTLDLKASAEGPQLALVPSEAE